jgi:hypothetical protein
MALWEQEQRAPRLMKPETARLAQESLMLNDGSLTNYGYGWFTSAVRGAPARHHSGQTAGFVAEYLRFPERDLAVVVLTNRYDAPVSASRVALFADPSLGGPPFIAAQDFDPARAARVRHVVASAASAGSDWREEWFATDFWSRIKPNLPEIEDNYRRRGPLKAITPVGPAGLQDASKPSYRVTFEKITRLLTFEFDGKGMIKSFSGEDE